jgi:hypothetical protein
MTLSPNFFFNLRLIAFPEVEIDSELQTMETVASISLNLSGIDAKTAFSLFFFEFHKKLFSRNECFY